MIRERWQEPLRALIQYWNNEYSSFARNRFTYEATIDDVWHLTALNYGRGPANAFRCQLSTGGLSDYRALWHDSEDVDITKKNVRLPKRLPKRTVPVDTRSRQS